MGPVQRNSILSLLGVMVGIVAVERQSWAQYAQPRVAPVVPRYATPQPMTSRSNYAPIQHSPAPLAPIANGRAATGMRYGLHAAEDVERGPAPSPPQTSYFAPQRMASRTPYQLVQTDVPNVPLLPSPAAESTVTDYSLEPHLAPRAHEPAPIVPGSSYPEQTASQDAGAPESQYHGASERSSASGEASCGNSFGTGCDASCGTENCGSTCGPCRTFGEPCEGCGGVDCWGGCVATPKHGFVGYGEFLYLRPRDAQVAYAVPIDGPVAPALGNGIQIGPTELVDPNHHAGFRVGGGVSMSDCSVLGAEFMHFDSHTTDTAFIGPPFVLRSLVTHPLGDNAATDGLRASANLDIDMNTVDLTYRGLWRDARRLRLDYVVGLRYGQLEQEFQSEFNTNGVTSVDTDIQFNGTGPLAGFRFDRNIGCVGLFLYGRGEAAFLVGKSDAHYLQSDAFAGSVVDTAWESGRVVSQLGMELGFGWSNVTDRFRLSCGYMVQSWFNTVRTDEFIQAVQWNDFVGLGDGLTMDGVVVHGEWRF